MKKKVYIIDDSALMRRVLSDIINSDERFQAAGYAINGLEAFQVLEKRANEFDAVLLDINMPVMNGIELLEKLKENGIRATIIIVSTIAKREAKETIRALELGAFDFVAKPESYLEVKSNIFSKLLLHHLAVATKMEQDIDNDIVIDEQLRKVSSKKQENRVKNLNASKLVALACSTGGPKALHTVIPALPKNLDSSILIVQHMPGGFTKSLADRLNELSQIKVKEAEDKEIIKKGTVYIAKGGYQMRLVKGVDNVYQLSVTKEPARHGLSPCADILYESLSETDFDQITCVVLTGMGGDGTEGIKFLSKKRKSIYVIAQNEETSIVYGMPKVIKDAGLVDEVVALSNVSEAIIKNVGVH